MQTQFNSLEDSNLNIKTSNHHNQFTKLVFAMKSRLRATLIAFNSSKGYNFLNN